jgi:hypothetical protein
MQITPHGYLFGLNVLGYAHAILDGDWSRCAYELSLRNGDVHYHKEHATIAPNRDRGLVQRG